MTNEDLTYYFQQVDEGNVASSFQTLERLYGTANHALADIAKGFGDGKVDVGELERSFLIDQDFLIGLAIRTKCKDVHEICHKLAFLKREHLDEIDAENYSPADRLILSIGEDRQAKL